MSDSTNPEDTSVALTPYLVARETPAGVRYVRPLGVRRNGLPPFLGSHLFAFGLLAAAASVAVYALAVSWQAVPAWPAALALLYPLQLALDLTATARQAWRFAAWFLGDLEIELTNDRLRAGKRWLGVWLKPQSLPIGSLQQLVIVKRAPQPRHVGSDWDLVAQPDDGPPMSLVNAYDEPELIRSIARDLHRRLGFIPQKARDWPPLVEVDGPAATPTVRPPLRGMMPGGAYGWFAVHVAGSVGLWYVVKAVTENPQSPSWLRLALFAAFVLQLFVFLANYAYLKASRPTGPPKSPG
jgi:hypothetical protein